MNRINISTDINRIANYRTFFVDEMLPLCYKEEANDILRILFLVKSDSTQEVIYISSMIKLEDNDEKEFFKKSHLNLDNIKADKDRIGKYSELTKEMRNSNLYQSGLDLKEDDDSRFFSALAYKKMGNYHIGIVEELKLRFSKKMFIRLYSYFYLISTLNPLSETVFFDNKFNVMKFINVNSVQLLGSFTELDSNVITTNYKAGYRRAIYSFNFIAPKMDTNLPIRGLVSKNKFLSLYGKAELASIILYNPHTDKVYVLLEEKNHITNEFKSIVVLVFEKEYYKKTNLINYKNIYSRQNEGEDDNEEN